MNLFNSFSEGTSSKDEKKVCTTVSGAAPNLPCIFPFRFNGVTHTTCIWDMAHLTEHKAWCSTLVDDSGHHVGGQGKWGNCGPDCPIPKDTRNQTKVPGRTTQDFYIHWCIYVLHCVHSDGGSKEGFALYLHHNVSFRTSTKPRDHFSLAFFVCITF